MPYASLGDVRTFYTDDGPDETATHEGAAAPPLLLVHGWGADSHEWIWHIPTLSKRRRVISVDLRGHGYSSVPSQGYHPRDMVGDLVGLLGHLGVERVIPAGHSLGAQVVSILAVEHPDMVAALVTVEPGYGMTPELAAQFPEMVKALDSEHAGKVAVSIDEWSYTPATPQVIKLWHSRRLLAMPPHVLHEAFAAMFTASDQIGCRPASDEYLARRSCPVLTFWFDPEQAAWERGLFGDPASEAVSWQGSGHRLHEERPAEFCTMVEDWLSSLALEARS